MQQIALFKTQADVLQQTTDIDITCHLLTLCPHLLQTLCYIAPAQYSTLLLCNSFSHVLGTFWVTVTKPKCPKKGQGGRHDGAATDTEILHRASPDEQTWEDSLTKHVGSGKLISLFHIFFHFFIFV